MRNLIIGWFLGVVAAIVANVVNYSLRRKEMKANHRFELATKLRPKLELMIKVVKRGFLKSGEVATIIDVLGAIESNTSDVSVRKTVTFINKIASTCVVGCSSDERELLKSLQRLLRELGIG